MNPECGIPFVGVDGSLANIANIIACGLSILFVIYLVIVTSRRKAAVGRVELRLFLVLYLLTLPLQLVTTGSFIQQGSTALTVLTAIHAGIVAATFWALLGNAIVSTQIVEDGTLSSIIVSHKTVSLVPNTQESSAILVLHRGVHRGHHLHLPRRWIHLHLCIRALKSASSPAQCASLRLDDDLAWSVRISYVYSHCPAYPYRPRSAALLYFIIMLYIVLVMLNEIRPTWYYILAAVLFVLSQLDYFLLNKVICNVSSCALWRSVQLTLATQGVNPHRLDGSFVATILETAAVGVLHLAWRSITEGASSSSRWCRIPAHRMHRGLG